MAAPRRALARRPAISAVLPISLILLTALPSPGQEPSQPREAILFMEIPTVVSAAGVAQPLNEAPAAVSVLSAEDIKSSAALSIPDLFRLVAGLDYIRVSASNVGIAARGLNLPGNLARSRMQVLVDGQSVYEDVLGIIYWHEIPIPLDEIERIEVVKSPATALYGDKAFAGLVNIITKSPDQLRGTLVRETVGEAGTTITDIVHGGGSGPLRYKLSVGYDRTNQFSNPPDDRTGRQLGRADARGHAYVEGRIDETSTLSLTLGFDQFDRREVSIPTQTDVQVVSGYTGYAKLNYTRGDLRAQVSYSRFDGDIRADFQVRPYSPVVNILQAQLDYSTRLGASHLVSGGVTYRFLSADSAFFADGGGTQNLGRFYLQDQWSLLKNLTLTTGVGVDFHPEAGVSASPRGVLVFTPWPDHAFRVSVARAFRNPSFIENFLFEPVKTRPGQRGPIATLLGNDRLEPEEMRSYEVGYQGRLNGRVRVWVDFFYNQLENLIAPVAPKLLTVQFENFGRGDAYGTETGIEARLTSWLTGFANYTYLQRTGAADAMGMASNHKANIGFAASLPHGFSASTTGSYVGVPENSHTGVNAYFLVNVRVAKQFTVLGTPGELSLEVSNLFDDTHREIKGGDVIDRRTSGTLRLYF
jgi:iron complex outermembrane recepter protein